MLLLLCGLGFIEMVNQIYVLDIRLKNISNEKLNKYKEI